MLRFVSVFVLLSGLLLLWAADAVATSTQFGDTGLLTQPTAQTLNEGNICIGLWANCSSGSDKSPAASGESLIMPATLTMGLGTFMEVYGSYPNLVFNGDEDESGRGFANAGFKFRILGKRSDNFRVGLDLQGRRTISDDPDRDGLTDYVGRLIASLKLADTVGVHANVGYAVNDSTTAVDYDDQLLAGGGVEYSLATRLRLIAEVGMESEKIPGQGAYGDVTAGLQYFLTPHLTMNLGASIGMADASPDWRILMGLTTCQGVGTYNRPVPKLVDEEVPVEVAPKPVKVSKIRALTPLLTKIAVADSPVSQLEVPIEKPGESIIVNPADRLQAPLLRNLAASPIGPVGAAPPQTTGKALPEEPFPAKVKRIFRFPEVTYAFNQWDLSEEGRKSISLVAEELRKENRYFIVSIEGHTDDVGSDAYNQSLSFKRAVAAATHLVLNDGFDPARIFVKGYGEARPIDDNGTDLGRARNRRVELLILVPEGFEDIEIKIPAPTGPGNVMLQRAPTVDPLAIEQAIMEKTGAETAKPAGAFSQIDRPAQ